MDALTKDKFLSDEELEHLKKIIGGKSPTRDELLIQVALATGARAQEILNIEAKDFDDKKGTVYIRGLKGSRDRELPLPKRLYKRVKALGDKPFPITYPRLYQIWEKYSPNKKKFHALRHTFAVNTYKRTRDIKLVQMALGHKDLRNTMIYVEFVYSSEQLRRLLVG